MAAFAEYLASGKLTVSTAALGLAFVVLAVAASRIIHSLYFHPLRHFPGPWYSACSSLPLALASVTGREPEWLLRLAKKYGKDGRPIRITPSLLFFHRASDLREIYWDPKCNKKSTMYGHESIGPTSIFQVLDGQEHKALRKALGGGVWAIGSLKKNWEARLDGIIRNFKENQVQAEKRGETVVLSNKVAEFAADVLTMVLFSTPWGFVRNNRDERGMLRSWREGLSLFALSHRWRFFREVVLPSPLGPYLLPKESDRGGNGWLVAQAGREIGERRRRMDGEGYAPDPPDFLQQTIESRVEGRPLSPVEELANITLFIQAGADTTGSGLGATFRLLATHPEALARLRAEIDEADGKGLLSDIVQYDETREHLPYACAAIRESLRVNPPIPQILPRVAPAGGKQMVVVGGGSGGGDDGVGFFVPAGTEMTTQGYVVQRDAGVFGADAGRFRPERWLVPEDEVAAMEAASFVFGMGPRGCIGKDIALLEMHKLIPEVIRRFDIDIVREGRWLVRGGVAAHDPSFVVRLVSRKTDTKKAF